MTHMEPLADRLFPRGVRLRHFILLPAVAMGVFVVASRLVETAVAGRLGPGALQVYEVARLVAISVLMAGVIAWLAFRHRREYESKLHARQRILERTRDFLTGVIQGVGEAIITLDVDDRVASWNRAAEEIYGWSEEEMVGRSLERLLPAEDADARHDLRRLCELVRRGETIRDFEALRRHRSGKMITVRITRAPLYDSAGAYVGSTGIVRDVTELKKMEARLLERERLAAVGEMAAQVAHEIKNPLMGIRGACEILADALGSDHSCNEIAEETLRQVDRLNGTVEDLLRYGRPQRTNPVPTDPHALLDRVISVLWESPQASQVQLVRDYDPDVSAARVDPEQIEQVLFNLLLNALQAMDYQGELHVRTRVDAGRLRLVVEDTGPGFSPELAEKAFQPFFTTRSQGSGLGLAIVRNIVQAHDGRITAGNAPDGGARVTVELPLEAS